MLTIIMALAEVEGKYLFGDKSGKLPWGKIQADMDLFVSLTSEEGVYMCTQSTYDTLPKSVIERLKVKVVEDTNWEELPADVNHVVLGGRKLIDAALPFADHIIISEIGGIAQKKDSFIYLRDSTIQKLSQAEKETYCWYFATPSFDPKNPHLKQAYCLSRDRYNSSK